MLCCVLFRVPLDEMINEVFDALLHLMFLQGDRITFIGDLHNQLHQFVQLTLYLEETLGDQSKPERGQMRGRRGKSSFQFHDQQYYVMLIWVYSLFVRIYTGTNWK